MTHPDPHKDIIIEGHAQIIQGKTNLLRALFKAKYDWDIATDEDYTNIIDITPQKILAWSEELAGHRKRWSGEDSVIVDPASALNPSQ